MNITQLQTLLPSHTLKEQLPAWYHIGASHRLIELTNKPEAKCLRHLHKVQSVRDVKTIASTNCRGHKPKKNCKGTQCTVTRTATHCKNPHKCRLMAQQIIQTLQLKWDPDVNPPQDNLNLTPRRKSNNKQAEENRGPRIFDPNVTTNNIKEGFRVFIDPQLICPAPAIRTDQPEQDEQTLVVYTDGSCINPGTNNAQAGSGIWYSENDQRNQSLRVPGEEQTNQIAELYAVLQAAKSAPRHVPLVIRTDSEYVIRGLTKNLEKWEDKGWIGISNSYLFKAIAGWLRFRGNTTTLQWIKGHSGEPGNEAADKKAAEGALLPSEEKMDLITPANFVHTGAKLSCMSQAELYKGILEQETTKERQGTKIQLDITRWAVQDLNSQQPTNAKIWKSIQNKDITRSIRELLWKCLHNAHKCGKFWEKIPNFEQRSICPSCKIEESMEHILLECIAPGQATIWNIAKTLWQLKHNN